MQHIIENEERVGSFTSSNCYKLMKPADHGKKFATLGLTYIEEKRLERKLGRSLSMDFWSRETSWGNFMEYVVFPKLADWDIQHVSNKTIVHPKYPFWVGSPDFVAPMKKVAELKCYQPQNFAKLTDCLLTGNPMELKYEFPQIYWQVTSNAILEGVDVAEAMSFMPYRSELEAIAQMVDDYEGEDQYRYKWIYDMVERDGIWQLPFLADNSSYNNLNILTFEVPRDDRKALQEKMCDAGYLLIN